MQLQSELNLGFDLVYCSADVLRDRGGEKCRLKGAKLAKHVLMNTTPSSVASINTDDKHKDPAHDEHDTINLQYGDRIIKIHRYLIEEVDGMEVLF
jgi:hypothetical protein